MNDLEKYIHDKIDKEIKITVAVVVGILIITGIVLYFVLKA